ncbi:hypothetical protein DOY81_002862 [Sarcophaga bullata]|nr:hypothetical protein DOY81_002862 [Sarcophaga bullata]
MDCTLKLESHQCRTCYGSTKGLKPLTTLTQLNGSSGQHEQKSFAQLLKEITNINVLHDSYTELPQYICYDCIHKLKVAHAFVQQAAEVNKRLVDIVLKRTEAFSETDCLQETQVSVQEIKMETEELNPNVTEDENIVEIKLEETEIDINRNTTDSFISNEINNSQSYCNLEENVANKDVLSKEKLKNNESEESEAPSNDDKNSHDNQADDNELRDELDLANKVDLDSKNRLTKKGKLIEMYIAPEDENIAVACIQCDKIFDNLKVLLSHQRTSHIPEDQKSTCPICFRKFTQTCSMYTHMRTFHGPDTIPFVRKPLTQDRIFQCDKCSKNYTQKKYLNTHIKNKHSSDSSHNEKYNVEEEEANKVKSSQVRSLCSICGSSFSSKPHLVIHMRRHTGERPFKCDLCDRAYPRNSELIVHRRLHTGEKPFECKICGKAFRVSSKMNTHMRSHTDIRPYKCTHCERSFKYSKDLSIHLRIHTGERPYCCNVCGNTFTQSNALKAHRRKLEIFLLQIFSEYILGATFHENDSEVNGKQKKKLVIINIYDIIYSLADQSVIPRKCNSLRIDVSKSHPERSVPKHKKLNEDIFTILKQLNSQLKQIKQTEANIIKNQRVMINSQNGFEFNQQQMVNKLEKIEASMECNVAIRKIEATVCRMAGETHDKNFQKIASLLPMKTIAEVQNLEQRLETPDFIQTMITIL